eukprot:CAMPEP_0184657128 /NCGR_PEP_ID=MMETSP0308-20130426/17001_1 /TAXON_ID=38269 /ORGANISM="Gloeochaete witrockiana, Strain SAG 46.84" /LENGTH=268 /DNA_ID=CAMNT_0027094557 /DNA_START=119 /DNA_END=922 /DNA_ORIENTATION=-
MADARALFRQKLSQNEDRIDSPLVRYDASNKATCIICNVVIKSKSVFAAHCASKKHVAAAEEYKKKKASSSASSAAKADVASPVVKRKREEESGLEAGVTKDSKVAPKPESNGHSATSYSAVLQGPKPPVAGEQDAPKSLPSQSSGTSALPAGFFDDETADARARNAETPEERMNREWDSFQKTIKATEMEAEETRQELYEEDMEERIAREEAEQTECMSRVASLKGNLSNLKQRLTERAQPSLTKRAGLDDMLDEDVFDEEEELMDW